MIQPLEFHDFKMHFQMEIKIIWNGKLFNHKLMHNSEHIEHPYSVHLVEQSYKYFYHQKLSIKN